MNEDENLNGKIEDCQDRIRELEITLHGKRAKTGLLSEYERHDELLRRLYAVIWQDPTGQKGILHDIDILMERRKDTTQGTQYKWQFWGVILAAIATSFLANLDKIKTLFPKLPPTELQKLDYKVRHPKSGKTIIHYRVVPSPARPSDGEPSSDTKATHQE